MDCANDPGSEARAEAGPTSGPPTTRPSRARSNLLGLLILLVVVVAAPAFAVLLTFQWDLRSEREVQARAIAFQQVELINATMANLTAATREVMVALTNQASIQRLDPACGARLDRVRSQLPDYVLLAILAPDGVPVCSSAPGILVPEVLRGLVQPFLHVSDFMIGGYSDVVDKARPMLTFAMPFDGRGERQAGVIVIGLDLRRLGTALAGTPQHFGGEITIRDREATVLAHAPGDAGQIGMRSDGPDRGLMNQSASGSTLVTDGARRQRVLAYVPLPIAPAGLFVSAGFDVADLNSGINQAAERGYLLIGIGLVCSFLLALLYGQRLLRVPAAVLLGAARKLGGGDLSARATIPPGAATEFVGLGHAFNDMAATLQRQRAELQGLNDALELRVADRTRALLESNNRLQVEIAERELTESNLRQAQKLQAVGQLAGGVAHDFNNLLTVILGSLELLRKRVPVPDARATRLIDTATASVEHGSRLTAQLLAFSRKQPLLAVSTDVSDAIGGMGALLSSTLGDAVRLQLKVGEGVWPATLDPNQFEAAILNLALNAKAAMPKGGRANVAVANTVVTEADAGPDLPPGDYVRVAFSDSGTGMSSDAVSRAFEPFFTTKKAGGGSGLGLAQVHGMVQQSGGAVTIESRLGEGTTVTMLLPRSATLPVPNRADDPASLVPALARDRLVLLVDDDTAVREVTAAMLTEHGYAVVTAIDGRNGLEVLAREGQRVALVIADYAMPGMTGREMLETVHVRRPDVAMLLATGYADYPDLASETLTIDQIVRKPFRSRELLARIHMICSRQAGLHVPTGAPPH